MIIGLAGTFASGKDTVAEHIRNRGFFYTSLSDLVREECGRRGIPKDVDTLAETANEMRALHGASYFARLALQKINENSAKNALVVSIRNYGELEELRKNPDFKLIAVDAPIEIRYVRAATRKSEKDQVSFEKFKAMEEAQMTSRNANEMQMKKIIESADFTIINSGTLNELRAKIDDILNEICK